MYFKILFSVFKFIKILFLQSIKFGSRFYSITPAIINTFKISTALRYWSGNNLEMFGVKERKMYKGFSQAYLLCVIKRCTI
jgi:hypothetical protein